MGALRLSVCLDTDMAAGTWALAAASSGRRLLPFVIHF